MKWIEEHENDIYKKDGLYSSKKDHIFFDIISKKDHIFFDIISDDKKFEICLKHINEYNSWDPIQTLIPQNTLSTLYRNIDKVIGVVTAPKSETLFLNKEDPNQYRVESKTLTSVTVDINVLEQTENNFLLLNFFDNHARGLFFTDEELELYFEDFYDHISKYKRRNESIDDLLNPPLS